MRRMSLRPTRAGTVVLCALAFFAGCVALTAWQEPQPLQRGFIAGLMLCTSGMLLFAFGRFATALLVGGGLFLLLKSVAVLKLRYLDSQLMPSDFIYYVRSSLLDTLRHYPHLYTVGIGLGVLLPPLLYLVWRWDWRVLERPRSRRVAGVRLSGVASCALALWLCMLPSGPFARVHSRNAWQKMSDDAQLTNFFVNLHDADVELPAMADDAVAERDWGATAQGAPGSMSPYPDIVQVLEESTFDPSIYDACNVPACRVAMFRPDARTRAHGMLRVHTFGGGTWVSEFAALTGMPQDIFGPGGMYAPYVLAPNVRDALALQLRRLGYLTIGVYPTSADFINGRNAYQAYGFDHLYGADELGLEEWEESDAQMFAAAGRLYDKLKKPGQPVFLMILTLNQHGPHDHQPMATLPRPYRNLLRGLPANAALNFDTYLARLHASDLAMRALERAFLDRPQPTVLLHFGDHQPSFNGLIRNLPRRLPVDLQPYRDYLTYYMLKSNFAGPPLPQYPLLDIAFLPSMVLEAAGVPTDAYFAASTELRERCDGRYDDCAVPGLLASYHAWTIGRLHVYQ
ncbi:sulfatase-like hydrolase/transferase [Rhodanobacter denitrificans]|uniref:sulfatase-like hydrolase/transferase n=1 Tax=Rhodanobacter denitrificans TaxID=666685 RepID=UPI001F2E6281|nr:sulfatase-like hydrolase/transferase [Rhodanobacter denitrificans]UJJ57020.1 sulfatase-like hydrolase/transferase [Rhodanobacter denitrificans]